MGDRFEYEFRPNGGGSETSQHCTYCPKLMGEACTLTCSKIYEQLQADRAADRVLVDDEPKGDGGIMKLESWQSSADKHPWKLVRTDSFLDIEGEIVDADETTGECHVSVGGETKALQFGPGGVAIVPRRR